MHEFTDLPKLPLTSSQCSADKISLACIFFFFVGSSNLSSTGCLFSALCSLLSVLAQLQLSA